MKNGVVITTAIRAEMARECIQRAIEHIPKPRTIVVIDNASKSPEIRNFKEEFGDEIIYHRFENDKDGGLTRCWNWGIEYCIQNGCDVVLQMNDDIFIYHDVHKMFDAPRQEPRALVMFGPVSNNPGLDYTDQQLCPDQEFAKGELEYEKIFDASEGCVNGFMFSCHANTYQTMKNTFGFYFDQRLYPWGGQEEDFGRKLRILGGFPAVIKTCWVYHEKFKDWEKRKFLG